MLIQLGPHGFFEQIAMRGTSPAIRDAASGNHLTVACTPASTHSYTLILDVNGVTVAQTVVEQPLVAWAPEMYMYGINGGGTAVFTNLSTARWVNTGS
jgi:hypothetical protein